MEVVDVSNCFFIEFVVRFCFFIGIEDVGGDGDSGELFSDGKVGIFFIGVVCFFFFWEYVFFGRYGSFLFVLIFNSFIYLILKCFKIVLNLNYWYKN